MVRLVRGTRHLDRVVLDGDGDVLRDDARQLTLRPLHAHRIAFNGNGDALGDSDGQLSDT